MRGENEQVETAIGYREGWMNRKTRDKERKGKRRDSRT